MDTEADFSAKIKIQQANDTSGQKDTHPCPGLEQPVGQITPEIGYEEEAECDQQERNGPGCRFGRPYRLEEKRQEGKHWKEVEKTAQGFEKQVFCQCAFWDRPCQERADLYAREFLQEQTQHKVNHEIVDQEFSHDEHGILTGQCVCNDLVQKKPQCEEVQCKIQYQDPEEDRFQEFLLKCR